jgi:hypothetical protein
MKRVLILAALPLLATEAHAGQLEDTLAIAKEAQACIQGIYAINLSPRNSRRDELQADAVAACEPPMIREALALDPTANRLGLHNWLVGLASREYDDMLERLRRLNEQQR